MRKTPGTAALIAAALLSLAACGGAAPSHGASSAPPSALALARKIAGVTGCQQQTPDVEVASDVTCDLPGGSQVEIAAFATHAGEVQWIANGGSGSPPDPSYAGCCIEGTLWAATVGAPDYVDTGSVPVIRALGGRVVNG